jgi:gliding motility-associated-like protein
MYSYPYSAFSKAFFFVLTLLSLQSFAQKKVKFTINTTQERKTISPLIYGTNDNYEYAAAKRLGGNRITNFNWENNASNAGRDWYHESDNYVPWEQGVPEGKYNVPGAALNSFHTRSIAQGAYSLVTLPMAKYVAKDKNGAVTAAQKAPSNRWLSVVNRKPTALLPLKTNPDQTDKYIYTQEEINYLISTFGKSNTAKGVKAYALDNEPGLWFDSHSRMWGSDHVSVKYLIDQSFELAELIKEMDPTAEVFGPASWGVSEFENLQGAPDWDAIHGDYSTFIDLYLAKMKERSEASKKRLLDVLDLHWYPQGNNDGVDPFGNGTDYNTNARRMAMTRSLWDPSYIEDTWIGQDAYKVEQFLPFIPKMKKHINTYYPGTKFALTEYSYMGAGHVSGGIAQADALGIFGKQELYLATYWGGVTGFIKSGFDIYRNYDGKGGKFGNTSIKSITNDIINSSIHASIEDTNDKLLHVIAMNKNQDEEITTTFAVTSGKKYKSAKVWAFDNSNSTVRQLKNVKVITNNTFEYKIPPLTVCHLLLTEEDLSIYPDIDEVTVNPSVGYSDGTASFSLNIKVSDGNNDITKVTADLSAVGGKAGTILTADKTLANTYKYTQKIPKGTVSGLKSIKINVEDKTHYTAESFVNYRVIKKTASKVIWDGDAITRGKGEAFYDPNDSKQPVIKVLRQTTGGNNAPGSLYMHFEHDQNKYNTLTWRLSNNNNPADAVDISDYGVLEFYIRSDAPAGSDIEMSLRDASAQLESSTSVALKANGYISSFSKTAYTRVRIPMSAFTSGSKIHLDQLWQFSFVVNTATKGFNVWMDDFRVLPYSHPVYKPKLAELKLTSTQGYADNKWNVTISAKATDPDNNLSLVTVDLSPINGPNRQAMKLIDGKYTTSFKVPESAIKGLKSFRVTATDANENYADTVARFKVLEKASDLVLWDGDKFNTGEPISVNPESKVTINNTGGKNEPISMRMHLGSAGDGFGSAHWDWNLGTGDTELRDVGSKGYIKFYLKVLKPYAGLELEVFFKDRLVASTSPVRLIADGYLKSFTGDYQLVTIPISKIMAGDKIDLEQVARIGLLSSVLKTGGVDVVLDDIIAGGSNVADVKFAITGATCGNANGIIKVNSVNGKTTGFTYLMDGKANPLGATNPAFTKLAPGKHELRIEGANGFVYIEIVTIADVSDAIHAIGAIKTNNITLTVSDGSGTYQYLWNDKVTTKDRKNLKPGNYSVTVTDVVSLCTVTKTFAITKPKTALVSDVVINSALSPNGDGINDKLIISGLTAYPDNSLSIINTSGVPVFEAINYSNAKLFDGHDRNGKTLNAGTYYYQLKYKADGEIIIKSGYILLKY